MRASGPEAGRRAEGGEGEAESGCASFDSV